MTLPFDNNKDLRKWQCFCCSLVFNNYIDYHEHIVSNHEQGKDYVVCPKCAAPIRDLVLHMRSRHAGWAIPPGHQLRATVWKDQWTKKKKPGVNFKKGNFISAKNGREIFYRSGLEKEVYELLESDPNVVGYLAETLKIPYLFEGKQHTYIPDLIIQFTNGTKAIWEIKPGSQTSLPINEAKWTAAQQYCDHVGLDFMVLTETGIGKLKKQIYQNKNKI